MTALLLDIGNTRLKWGVLEDGEIHRTGHITRETIKRDGFGVLTKRLPRRLDSVLASNVAGPNFATRLSGVIGLHCDGDVNYARSERRACGLTNGYRQPRRLGVDRWVAMIGAWAEYEAACLVVDAGTAVTIDAIDDEGRHLGGQILPGVALMAEALGGAADGIPVPKAIRLKQSQGQAMFAAETRGAVAHGALNAVTGAVDRALYTLQEIGHDPEVILTGGDASRILGSLDEELEPVHRPHLVLHGLARLLEDRG